MIDASRFVLSYHEFFEINLVFCHIDALFVDNQYAICDRARNCLSLLWGEWQIVRRAAKVSMGHVFQGYCLRLSRSKIQKLLVFSPSFSGIGDVNARES